MSARLFDFILKNRVLVLVIYAVILLPAIYFATQVQTDNSLDRMVVPGNEGKIIFDRFKEYFGSDEFILLGFEGKNIYSEEFLVKVDEIERQLQKVPYLGQSRSLISIYRAVHPMFNPHNAQSRKEFRDFTLSTPFFNYQGLISPDRMLTIVLQLQINNSDQRREVVKVSNEILKPFEDDPSSPFNHILKVGQPNLNYELDKSTVEIGAKFFPIYLLFAMMFLFFLYRSFKGIFAVLVTMLVSIAMAVALVVVCGSVLTMVSSVLPMMVLIVTIETMVHIYSGYIRPPQGVEIREHLINILVRKWRACWFSVLTTSVGFGSFATSPVLPIRDLGIFVAIALIVGFVACFTLFPVLLDILKPQTGRNVNNIGLRIFDPILAGVPTYSYWWRKPLVPFVMILGIIGIYSFFQMEVETNSLNYLNKENPLYKDTTYIENNLMGLMSMEIMLEGDKGQFSSPNVHRQLTEFEDEILKEKDVQSILSTSTLLRMANFIENGKDNFPGSNFAVSKYILALSQQNTWSNYVSKDFDALRISAVTKNVDYHVFNKLEDITRSKWKIFQEKYPEYKNVKLEITGMALLTANITRFLLDTLVSSFGLTLLIVFIVFLVVIRKFSYSVLSILPSLFAIVFMYLVMTLLGVKLDIGSIMIAAVVLGISVDATIHFFQHYMVKLRSGSSLEESLSYSLIITGRAIVVSTIVIFSGFVTFAFSSFPPIKHFGFYTSIAMLFSLIGTVLFVPACLWLLSPKEKPEHLEDYNNSKFRMLPPMPEIKEIVVDEDEE